MSIIDLIRQDLRDMRPYQSARSLVNDADLFLDANECQGNGKPELCRYPKQQPEELIKLASQYYQCETDQLLATRGSDEGIDLLLRLFVQAYKDKILIFKPTFGMYEVAARIQGAGIDVVDTAPDFYVDINRMRDATTREHKLVFLCSPNNPTGTTIPKKDIALLCEAMLDKAIVVVDEAYQEFSDKESAVSLVDTYDNLVVLRTLSKAFGLAGLRVGFMIASSALINYARVLLAPYPLPTPSIDNAIDALSACSIKDMHVRVDSVKEQRELMYSTLSQLDCVEKVYQSAGNFLLLKSSLDLYTHLLRDGIVARRQAIGSDDDNYLRITISTPEENARVVSSLAEVEVCYD